LPAGDDAALEGYVPLVPICADESCHVAADLARLRARYAMVNIKLDKTGGLTEALDLLAGARAAGMGVMVGCMISTSLSIAPAFYLAAQADCADLDGPLWLKEDRAGGVTLQDGGMMQPPAPGFWGAA
jgi:L-alanine-DL-glutamate epimerase-like enolase superfamily enzyme